MQSTTNKGSPTAGNATASGHGQPFGRSAGGHGRGHGTGTGAVQQSLRGRGFDEQVQLLAPRGAVVQRDAAEPASASRQRSRPQRTRGRSRSQRTLGPSRSQRTRGPPTRPTRRSR